MQTHKSRTLVVKKRYGNGSTSCLETSDPRNFTPNINLSKNDYANGPNMHSKVSRKQTIILMVGELRKFYFHTDITLQPGQ